jgi:GNAT superfamily N-acetyltransferase
MRIVDTVSPLKYDHILPVKRMSVVEDDAPPTDEAYFAPIVKTRIGSIIINKQPDLVGFLDWHSSVSGWVHIDYVLVRKDFRRLGIATLLIEEFYQRHRDAMGVDWGRIMDDSMLKLFQRRRLAEHSGATPRSIGKVW